MERLCPVCNRNPLEGKQQSCSSACRTAKHRAKQASETAHTATPRTLPKRRNTKQERGPRSPEHSRTAEITPDHSVPSSVAERLLLAIAELRTAVASSSTEPRIDMRAQITSQAPPDAIGYRLVLPHHEPGVLPSFSPRRRDGALRTLYSLSPFQYPDDLRLCDGRWYRIVWIDSQGKRIRTPASCPIPGLRYVVGPADAVATATATMSAPPIETECAAAPQSEPASAAEKAPDTAQEAATETSRDTPEQAPSIHVTDTPSATKDTAVTEKSAETSTTILSQESASGTVTPEPREAPEPSAVARPAESASASARQESQMEGASSRAQNLADQHRQTQGYLPTHSEAENLPSLLSRSGLHRSALIAFLVNTGKAPALPAPASWSRVLDSFPPMSDEETVMTALFSTQYWLLAQLLQESKREGSTSKTGAPLCSYPIGAEQRSQVRDLLWEESMSSAFAPRCVAIVRYVREHGASALAHFPHPISPVSVEQRNAIDRALRNPIKLAYMQYLSERCDAALDGKSEPEEPKLSLNRKEQRQLIHALADIRSMMYFRERSKSSPVKSHASA